MFETLRRLHQLSYAETVVWQRDVGSMTREALVQQRRLLTRQAETTKTLINTQDIINKIGASVFLLTSLVTGEVSPVLGAVAILGASMPFSYLMHLHYQLTQERAGMVQDLLIRESYGNR